MKGFTTKAVHAKFLKKDIHGALHMPVYDSASFEFENSEEISLAFTGKKPYHSYSRSSNPTVEHFEQKVKSMTGAFSVFALASGMAAITSLVLAVAKSGDNIVTTKHLFGNTISLFEKTLKPWGLNVKYADFTKQDEIEKIIDEKTVMIFCETITNPQLEVADLRAISDIARNRKILFAVDSTITPLYFADMKDLGVNIEIISSTKFISGGATSIGGVIIDYGTFEWSNISKLKDESVKSGPFALMQKLKRETIRNTGPCLSAHNAYLQSLGLETLSLRAERTCANALFIARHLAKVKKIKCVNYPGLETSGFYDLSKAQFRFSGGILTADLSSKDECYRFRDKLQLVKRATNLNDNRTLVIHPHSTIYCEFDDVTKKDLGVYDTTVRISAGIEDIEDITDDMDQALEAL
jgi:O-acetylhomoserine (thiol)-lyase